MRSLVVCCKTKTVFFSAYSAAVLHELRDLRLCACRSQNLKTQRPQRSAAEYTEETSLNSWRCCRQWQALLRHINHEPASVQTVLVGAVGASGIPDCSDFHFLAALCDLGRLTALLLDEGLDHLSRYAGGKLAVFSAFEQYGDHDFRISSRSYSHEPGVVLVFGLAVSGLGLERIAHGLRAPSLSGKIDSLQMRAARRTQGCGHIRHGIGDDLPVCGINRDFHLARCIRGGNDIRWQLRWIGHMRPHQQAAARNRANGTGQLNGSHGDGSLADADGNGLSGVPLLFKVAYLPFFGRHHSADFLRQVDTGLL